MFEGKHGFVSLYKYVFSFMIIFFLQEILISIEGKNTLVVVLKNTRNMVINF